MANLSVIPEGPEPILESLRGKSVVLPDLNAILHGWPREVNQGLEQVRNDVDEWLEKYRDRFLLRESRNVEHERS